MNKILITRILLVEPLEWFCYQFGNLKWDMENFPWLGSEIKLWFMLIIIWRLIILGKIACANVLSDLYAMGVTECDNMLMLLAVSTKMTEKERDVVIPLVIFLTYS